MCRKLLLTVCSQVAVPPDSEQITASFLKQKHIFSLNLCFCVFLKQVANSSPHLSSGENEGDADMVGLMLISLN